MSEEDLARLGTGVQQCWRSGYRYTRGFVSMTVTGGSRGSSSTIVQQRGCTELAQCEGLEGHIPRF